MMPDTVEIEDIATTKTAAAIDPDGDYLVGQSAAGSTFKALVEQVVRGVLAQLATELEIGDDLLVSGTALTVDGTDAKVTFGPGNLGTQSGVRVNIAGGAAGFHGLGLGTDVNNRFYLVWDAVGGKASIGIVSSGTNYSNRIALLDDYVGIGGVTTPAVPLQIAGHIAITDGVSAPSTISGYAQLYVDSADGDLKIKFGDGTTKTIVTDT